jgi:hypothetical protein
MLEGIPPRARLWGIGDAVNVLEDWKITLAK